MGIEDILLLVLNSPGGQIAITSIGLFFLVRAISTVLSGTGILTRNSGESFKTVTETLERRIEQLEKDDERKEARITELSTKLDDVTAKLNQQIGINQQLERNMLQVVGDKDQLLMQLGRAHQEVEQVTADRTRFEREVSELQSYIKDTLSKFEERVEALEHRTQPIETILVEEETVISTKKEVSSGL